MARAQRTHDEATVEMFRRPNHRLRLDEAVRDRLLAINILPRLAGGDEWNRVPVVRRADDDAINIFTIKQGAKIFIDFRRATLLFHHVCHCGFGVLAIHIAYRTDRHTGEFHQAAHVRAPHAARPNEAEDNLVICAP